MDTDISYAGFDALHDATSSVIGSQQVPSAEPIITADDLAYILFCKADLELQKNFLTDFGLAVAEQTADTLYMRGTGPLPYFYVAYDVEKSRAEHGTANRGFLGLGFSVNTEDELRLISQATGSAVETVDGPGGGQRVRLHDPDGFIVDVVWGRDLVERLPTRTTLTSINTQFEKKRINEPVRTPLQPSPIERLGHCVMSVSDFNQSLEWYIRHLGLIPTDVQCLADGTPALSFNRLNRGPKPADHHTVVLIQNVEPAYMHSAYETLDLDSVGQGQQYLTWKGWTHFWGIGRHILGSQIFDYWLDPDGDEVEHYADGDVFDDSFETRYHPLDRGGLWAWGDDIADAMRPRFSIRQLLSAVKAVRSGKLSGKQLGLTRQALSMPPRPWLK